jgi:hypothetical protein
VADAAIPVTPGTGEFVDGETLTVGSNTVLRQRAQISGASALEVARVQATVPAGTEYAVVTRPIGPVSTTATSPNGAARSIFAYVNPYGTSRVSVEPTTVFVDSFDGGVLDTTARWATSGTQIATQSAGTAILAPTVGVNLTNTSVLTSQPIFSPVGMGMLVFGSTVTLEAASAATQTRRFWGFGQVTSFAYATPVTDGVGFEVDEAGALSCVVWIAGTKYVINSSDATKVSSSIALGGAAGTALPTGGVGSAYGAALTWQNGSHRYAVLRRADIDFWYIEGQEVPVAYASYVTPSVQGQALRYSAATNPASTSTAITFQVGAAVVADSTAQNHTLSDATNPWRRAVVTPAGAQRVAVGQPTILQKKSGTSTGSVASLAVTFDTATTTGTIVVACGVGNVTTPTITDTNGNTYTLARVQAVGAAALSAIFTTPNTMPGKSVTVTVTNGGAAASIAAEIYEVDGLLASSPLATLDVSAIATATSTTPATVPLAVTAPNDLLFFAVSVGTAAQTITPAAGWTNDSGQLNPTTPAGLFSFASMSQYAPTVTAITPSSTIVSEPWAAVAVAFRSAAVQVQGLVGLAAGTAIIGSLALNQSSNVAQINGTQPLMGNGVTGIGAQRVTITSDNTAFSVNPQPTTAGGLSTQSTLLAASNNLTFAKASAGQVYGIQAFGTGSAPYWLKLYNKASAPVVATDSALILKRILVPANATAANGGGVVLSWPHGIVFGTGIAWSAVGLQADADTTNTAAAGAVNLDYK